MPMIAGATTRQAQTSPAPRVRNRPRRRSNAPPTSKINETARNANITIIAGDCRCLRPMSPPTHLPPPCADAARGTDRSTRPPKAHSKRPMHRQVARQRTPSRTAPGALLFQRLRCSRSRCPVVGGATSQIQDRVHIIASRPGAIARSNEQHAGPGGPAPAKPIAEILAALRATASGSRDDVSRSSGPGARYAALRHRPRGRGSRRT